MSTIRKDRKHEILVFVIVLVMVCVICLCAVNAAYFSSNINGTQAQFAAISDETSISITSLRRAQSIPSNHMVHNHSFDQNATQIQLTEWFADVFRFGMLLTPCILLFAFISISYIHKQNEISRG